MYLTRKVRNPGAVGAGTAIGYGGILILGRVDYMEAFDSAKLRRPGDLALGRIKGRCGLLAVLFACPLISNVVARNG